MPLEKILLIDRGSEPVEPSGQTAELPWSCMGILLLPFIVVILLVPSLARSFLLERLDGSSFPSHHNPGWLPLKKQNQAKHPTQTSNPALVCSWPQSNVIQELWDRRGGRSSSHPGGRERVPGFLHSSPAVKGLSLAVITSSKIYFLKIIK